MKKKLVSFLTALACCSVGAVQVSAADSAGAIPVQTLTPNMHGKSLTTPTAAGAWGNTVYFGAGGTSPAPYSDEADGAAAMGIGLGNPYNSLGLQATFVSIDLTEWEEYSMSLHLHRQLDCGCGVAVGVENIMLTEGGDSESSHYIVFSQVLQGDDYKNGNGASKLHYSIGAGTNRYGQKSDADVEAGKSRYGTYVFGNISYELFNEFNAILDWNGINLNAGISKTFFVSNVPLGVSLGLADLTDNSGDQVRFIFGIGTGFKL